MSWIQKDEWIDLEKSRHVVVFHNPDTGGEHHLIHEFNMPVCPHCGQTKERSGATPIDFQQVKDSTLTALNDHHRRLAAYREQHPQARLGKGPK